MDWIASADRALFLFFNSTISNPLFDAVFPVITNKTFWIIPALIASILLYRKEKRRALFVIGLSVLAVAVADPLCARVLKPLFHRLRPCDPGVVIEGARYLLGQKSSFSFPSCHAMNAFALAGTWFAFYPKRWPWFLLLAILSGFSRIYTGVHYPLDVLAGALIGTGIGYELVRGLAKLLGKKGITFLS